jgi:DNA-binding MarR family transcriptional regulator
MRDLDISAAQMTILVVINELKIARPSDISHVLDIELSTLTRNLRRMLDHGWLKKVDSPDARTHPLQITRSGQQLLVKAHPLWKQAQREAKKLMGEAMARELHAVAAPNPLP